ncbi:hypothetical protein EK0264_03550 [Epidermidibacterium keratini]|uniref:Uncharacterized protein n=1 Tax=Epidermidibacterium keratini TaxID=1891644 RepID=A0A7L4YT35_9ACTN|nr:hypothetical protein EK0264_03550 [Epidermidibacterium keratini]
MVDSLTLRFTGKDDDGTQLHELRAAHVAQVLQGLVGITSDFDKAGVFHDEGPSGSEVLVRPAEEGSFIIEIVRVVTENWEVVTAAGIPTMGQIIWWATRSARAEVEDFEHQEDGSVKIKWQDKTVDEVPARVWEELKVRKPRRKKQLREIMAPLSDPRVKTLDVTDDQDADTAASDDAPETYTLTRADYDAVKPEDEIKQTEKTFEVEAQMAAVDFDSSERWRVKTSDGASRAVTVEDETFLARIANGLAIRKTDIFRLRIREDRTVTNGRTSTKWVVLKVENHRRSVNDDGDSSNEVSPPS